MIKEKIKQYSTLVMFEHTIFSLSFGVVSMLMAKMGVIDIRTFALVLVAFLSARTGANAINRVIDAEIDARNPRTANRQIPQEIIGKREVIIFTIVCFAILVVSAFMLSPLTGFLSPIALFMMTTYSYTKRFTWCCHLYLGVTSAIAPMGAWLAVTGEFHIVPLILAAVNTLWVAGFDVIYGSQDYDFDKENNIHSMPRRFGVKNALRFAVVFHIFAVLGMIAVGIIAEGINEIVFLAGVAIIAGLLIYEHRIISPTNLVHAKVAAYSVNQVVSVVFLVFGVASVYF